MMAQATENQTQGNYDMPCSMLNAGGRKIDISYHIYTCTCVYVCMYSH